ncbi:MAG: DUF305 domain-containing protein [Blastocatellia bacterium]
MKIVLITFVFVFFTSCSSSSTESNHAANGNSTADHSRMDHSKMDHAKMESSPGAAEAPLELQFIDTMIVHHQGAVDMAKLAVTRAENPQLKKFAQGIVSAQEREIAEMTRWRAKWFGEKPTAINMDFPGMLEGMSNMDVKKLEKLSGKPFDLEFIQQMIPHHEGAVTMAKQIKDTDSYAELKKLAEAVIKDQSGEIEQMKKWQAEWGIEK